MTLDTERQQHEVSAPEHWFERDPLWFKRAVFYEIHLRGFSTATTTARATSWA